MIIYKVVDRTDYGRNNTTYHMTVDLAAREVEERKLLHKYNPPAQKLIEYFPIYVEEPILGDLEK